MITDVFTTERKRERGGERKEASKDRKKDNIELSLAPHAVDGKWIGGLDLTRARASAYAMESELEPFLIGNLTQVGQGHASLSTKVNNHEM